jgi:ATP adenylyltransferase
MDRLFTPWRYRYVSGEAREEGCIFCNRLPAGAEGQGGDQRIHVLHRARWWYVILNLFPYNNGHLLLVLNRHAPSICDLTPDELGEMAALLPAMERSLRKAYQPQGINCGYNAGSSAGAGVPEHFHVHMLPRWNGDTSFMTTIGDTRIMPETLAETYARLRPALLAELGV